MKCTTLFCVFLSDCSRARILRELTFTSGKATQTQHSVGNAACGHAVCTAHTESNVGRGDHAPGNRFAVQQPPVAGFGFERVANGVAQIQNSAQAVLALVRGNDFRF